MDSLNSYLPVSTHFLFASNVQLRIISEKKVSFYQKADLLYLYSKFPPEPIRAPKNTSIWVKGRLVVHDTENNCIEIWKPNDDGFTLSSRTYE